MINFISNECCLKIQILATVSIKKFVNKKKKSYAKLCKLCFTYPILLLDLSVETSKFSNDHLKT